MKKGIGYVIVASLLYGTMPLIVKQILKMGVSAQMVVNFRFLFAAFFLLIYFMILKKNILLSKHQLVQVLLFGVSGFGITGWLLTLSYQYLSSGMATVFHFTAPLFVNLILFIVFKERISIKTLFSILCAVVGMVMMFYSSAELSIKGMLLAATSGLTYAIYMVSVQKSDLHKIDSFVIVFYISLVSGLLFSCMSVVQHAFILPKEPLAYGLCAIVALCCSIIPMTLLTLSIQQIGSVKTSTLNMLEPLTSVILGVVLLHEEMNFFIFIGICLILIAILRVVNEKKEIKE